MLCNFFASLRSGHRKSGVRNLPPGGGHRLNVEPLETRLVPACNVAFAQLTGVLTIDCGRANDVVNISDNGAGVVAGDATGGNGLQEGFGPFAPVSRVNVAGGKGNDTVNYTLVGNNTTPMTVNLGLGDNADTANVRAVGVAINSDLSITVNGGKDSDTVSAAVDVVLAGNLALNLNGGDANDTLSATVMFEAGSAGNYNGIVNGSKGDDTLTHIVRQAVGSNVNIVAIVDGSPGFDIAFRTINVEPENIERDNVVV